MDDLTAAAIREIADAAYVFGYATVDLQRILQQFALDPASAEFKAPPNEFSHARALADPTDRTIVAMNVDTPYSYAWLDLRDEPIVLTVPPFEADRYVSAQLIDLYTCIVGYVSPRTNGHGGGTFLVAGPQWEGPVPDGITKVFAAPTDFVLVLVRTQLFDEADLPAVIRIQDGFAVTPLSAFAGLPTPTRSALPDTIPPVDVRAAPDLRFFDVLAWMLDLMPVLPDDLDLREQMRRIGVGAGSSTTSSIDAGRRAAILDGMGAGAARMQQRARTIRSSAEIFGSRDFFAGDHLSRACGAMLGILGNSAEEYLGVGYQSDADGRPFDGSNDYDVTFAPDGLPPVGAFWSITLYDADRLLHPNPLRRYVLGSRQLPDLTRDADGGVTITISATAPDAPRIANWLPCPAGPFNLAFRTYLPGPEIRSGAWTAPPVRRRA
jgi:hypothetical protein